MYPRAAGSVVDDRATRRFMVLGGLFIANLIIAEVIGVEIYRAGAVVDRLAGAAAMAGDTQ